MIHDDDLQDVLHSLVKRAPNGKPAKTIAAECGKTYTTFMNELSGQPGFKVGVEMLLPIMNASGSDRPLEFLAGMRGGVFFKLPNAPAGLSRSEQQALKAVKEFGDLMGEFQQRASDGDISTEDRKVIRKEGHEAVAAILSFLEGLEG